MKTQGKKKYLVPTPAAYLLVDALPDEMTYPDSTAIWEDKLHSMSEGVGTLADFLKGQIAFTRTLCQKAYQAEIKVTGENVCPRCHKGVLLQRKGRNGLFWGCSNYPKCRMTCNDKNGRPDLDDANRRLARVPRDMTADASENGASSTPYHPVQPAAVYSNEATPASVGDEIAALNQLFSAADYEARLAATWQAMCRNAARHHLLGATSPDSPQAPWSILRRRSRQLRSSSISARAAGKVICAASRGAMVSSGVAPAIPTARQHSTTKRASLSSDMKM